MDRRRFIELGIAALATGAAAMVAGCGKTEQAPPRAGNQDKLWKMTDVSEKVTEPIDLAYAKNTPALFRDASFGKEDPNFKPKTGGG